MPIRWLTIFIDVPGDAADVAVGFWTRVTGSSASSWRGRHGEFATLVPADGDAYLRVQRVLSGTAGHHLDLHVDLAGETLDDAATRAEQFGAHIRHRADDLAVADSPGGFTFCLVPWDQESSVPSPTRLDDGSTSRLDQLCLDIPPDLFEAECSFWHELTGWSLRQGVLPEFRYLERPPGLPVRLLLQRRAHARSGDEVSAHIDFAAQDAAALADTHVAGNARISASFPHWITMADPVGRTYCLTRRDPMTGKLKTGRD